MTDYALSTNLYSYALAEAGFLGWPAHAGEAEVIRELAPGDIVVPKFAQSVTWRGDESALARQRRFVEALPLDLDYDELVRRYEDSVAGGRGTVPYLLHVTSTHENYSEPGGRAWTRVSVDKEPLARPLSMQEFLRLRAVPVEIAQQFKATVAAGRHLQRLPAGAAKAIRDAAASQDRGVFLRHYYVVEAGSSHAAEELLATAGQALGEGDRVFIASPGGLLGVHETNSSGHLVPLGKPIPRTPADLLELFEEAKTRARKEDYFSPKNAIAAARELGELLEGPVKLIEIEDFGQFHDRYVLLSQRITQALDLAARPGVRVTSDEPSDETEEASAEIDELAALQGLTVDAVKRHLPEGMVLTDAVLAEVVTALRAGKHLLLGGPPGTGKSTLAEALCRAVVASHYAVVTATADWTTFDTIGGYVPSNDGLTFEPGVVLRCLQQGDWLVIDELNRADIDKAFGPLFTLLAGAGASQPSRRSILPYRVDGRNVEIRWAEQRVDDEGPYLLTPGWRMIGTLNLRDKASLFQLSFAFLRRFAVVDVPLPPEDHYRSFFAALCTNLPSPERDQIVDAAIRLAFGPRELGPAILQDIALFLEHALAETAAGAPAYDDPVTAFATAVRLYAVPQYEGATAHDTAQVMNVLRSFWPDGPDRNWASLEESLNAVTLA